MQGIVSPRVGVLATRIIPERLTPHGVREQLKDGAELRHVPSTANVASPGLRLRQRWAWPSRRWECPRKRPP